MPFALPSPMISILLSGIGLFVVMFLTSQLGHRIGLARGQKVDGQFAVIETATLGLVALLLAFTFGIAMSRFEEGRQLIVRETNAIGTAYLRIDLLAPSDQPDMRHLMRSYLDSRLATYAIVTAGRDPEREVAQSRQLQDRIWKKTAETIGRAQPAAAILLTPAINAMIDVTTDRLVNYQAAIPMLVKALLASLAIISAFITGYTLGTRKLRSIIPTLVYSLVVSAVIYTVLDLDNPRYGLIRLDNVAGVLQGLQDSVR